MKRVLVVALLLAGMVGLWAEGAGEKEVSYKNPLVLAIESSEPPVASWLGASGLPGKWYSDFVFPTFMHKEGIPFEIRILPIVDGSTKLLDAAIAAGEPPDVYFDYGGRIPKYANPKYAIPLNDYLDKENLAQFIPSFLAPMTVDGKIYGLSETSWGMAFNVNTTLLEENGLPVPERSWTIDQFEQASRIIHRNNPEQTGTIFFAGTASGDYMILLWFGAFGAEFISDGRITIASEEGVECLEWMLYMIEEGLAYSGAAGLTDADVPQLWQTGNVLGTAGTTGYSDGHPQAGFKNGLATRAWEAKPVEFPSKGNAPMAMGWQGVAVLKRRGRTEEETRGAVKMAEYLTSAGFQSIRARGGRYVSRVDVPDTINPYPLWQIVKQIGEENGAMNLMGVSEYAKVRNLWYPTLQAAFSKQLTPREALEQFQAEANAILDSQ